MHLSTKSFSAFGSSAANHITSTNGRHSASEAMSAFFHNGAWLESSFHNKTSISLKLQISYIHKRRFISHINKKVKHLIQNLAPIFNNDFFPIFRALKNNRYKTPYLVLKSPLNSELVIILKSLKHLGIT